MEIQGVSSIAIQPGPIGLAAFSYSNIILDTTGATGSTQYLVPSAASLLQQFPGLDGQGLPISKPGDVWSKRYIQKRSEAVSIEPSDSSGSGTVAISAGLKVINVYLLWLTVSVGTVGVPATLNGTYVILSDQPSVSLTSAVVEDWDLVPKTSSITHSKTK